MFDLPCIIFAGGKSSRMGEDKALLPFGGYNTLTEFQYTRLKKLFKTVYISCKDKTKFDFTADFIEDINSYNIFAPTIAFVSIFKALNVDRFFALSVDTPFVNEPEFLKIISSDTQHAEVTIATTNLGMQPLCGIYHNSIKKKFDHMLNNNEHKLGFMLKNAKTTFVNFEDETPFLNLNHPNQYKEALTLI